MGETADPVAHVHRFVERHLQTIQAPGVAVGLTSRDGPLGVVTDGHADLAAREPVRPEHLFQIGSISKSFTAIAVLQEHEAGRLDLHAPVTQYLPWFDVRSPSGPITPHHLLTHTSGLPTGRDFTGEAVHELWALRETEVGFAPGTRFHYSNAGYKALGLVLEAIAGKPWWRLVRTRVLDPLRMTLTDPITTPETRSRSATGHVPPFDDRPRHPSQGLVPAPWIESATADGTICSTAGDMCAYIRMLLAGGDPLLTERSFSLMTQRAAEDPDAPGELYGYGLKTTTVDGHRCIGHTGSTVGFSAWMEMHPADGVGGHRPDQRGRDPRADRSLRLADPVDVVEARTAARNPRSRATRPRGRGRGVRRQVSLGVWGAHAHRRRGPVALGGPARAGSACAAEGRPVRRRSQ